MQSRAKAAPAGGSRSTRPRRRRGLAVAAVLTALAFSAWPAAAWMRVQDPETDQSRRDFMKTKLMFAQNILEGLSTRNHDLIRRGASEIERITQAEGWLVSDTAEYKHLSDDLRTIATRLVKAADEKNLEAAAFRYFDMTTNCMDCHDYSRAHRIY